LTEYEIRVYLAILRHPRSRVPEIARWSSVPQPKVYATLKRLIERGLCESQLGPINRYAAMPPQDAFLPLLEDLRAREGEAQSAIKNLKTEFTKGNQSLSRREGRLKLFQGKHAAARNFRFQLSNAEECVEVIMRWPLIVADDHGIIEDRVKQGVAVRILCELSEGPDQEAREFLESESVLGADIRWMAEVPMRMAIFDKKITTLPMVDPQPGEGDGFIMLEIRNQSLSQGFLKMFRMMWATADPL